MAQSNGYCAAARKRSKRSNRHKTSCWRNPFVVFFLCFAVLGSLRFRVPARSKSVASHLLLKRREQQRRKRESQQSLALQGNGAGEGDSIIVDTTSSDISMNISNATMSIGYTQIEKGKDANNRLYYKYRVVDQNDAPLTMILWASTIAAASDDDPAITSLIKLIADSPFPAVFFETPPFVPSDEQQQQTPFEFVLMDAPKLHEVATDHPNEDAFRGPLSTAKPSSKFGGVFTNLGGDATLIVPKLMEGKNTNAKCYSHLASFVRKAPPSQVAALWKLVAQAFLDRVALLSSSSSAAKPIWLSTSGTGVYWLHFRLDDTPKYYTYEPYKRFVPQTRVGDAVVGKTAIHT